MPVLCLFDSSEAVLYGESGVSIFKCILHTVTGTTMIHCLVIASYILKVRRKVRTWKY